MALIVALLQLKGSAFKQYCSELGINVHLPDLNRSPEQVVAQVSELIESLQEVALVGSSLGGFLRHILSRNIIFRLY